MSPSEYSEWQFATKSGTGFNFVEKSIQDQERWQTFCINHFTRSSQDFFDYQSKSKKDNKSILKRKKKTRTKWKSRKRRV
jgi:hypothetical protein